MKKTHCIFCQRTIIKPVLENKWALAFWDIHPVSEGHLLVIPKDHKETYFKITEAELLAIHELLRQDKSLVDQQSHPDGYNVGVNVGQFGGQTVMHCHFHLIPRYRGDDPHPAGGIRKLLPNGRRIFEN